MATQPRARLNTTPAASSSINSQPSEDQIRVRAYQLYEERGKLEGHDLEDWLQAKAELDLTSTSQA